jgi:glycosyltransferase involved in cell wall biosynthesis
MTSASRLVDRYRRSRALRDRVPAGFEDWARDRLLPLLDRTGGVAALETRLWGGFSRPALAGLEALLADPASPPRAAGAAALLLARWHGAAGATRTSLDLARLARDRSPALARDRRQAMIEAQLLDRTGRRDEARALIDARIRGFDVSAALLRANTLDEDAARLAAVNAVLSRSGLSGIAARDASAPLSLDNLRGAAEAGTASGQPVTVIVPVHDAEATLETALRSLADQTHADLEVLVVDDASQDSSADLAADFARADPRFRLIRQSGNTGSYGARNRALAEARGEFITVQDADDWSHPERIARHLADLLPGTAPYNVSDWARASTELRFTGPWRPSASLTGENFTSLFFRRDLVARCGPWDTARISADREFADRLDRLHAPGSRRRLLPGVPLAFGRSAPGSLTRASATHAATMAHGIRREYREAAALWHSGLDPDRLRETGWQAAPPFFPAPRAIRSRPGPEPAHDVLFIADFNLKGGAFHSAFNMIRAGLAAGLDCAALHYRRYDLEPGRPLDTDFRRFALENDVRIVAPGERLAARTVVVTYPAVFDQPMDRFPEIACERVAVVVNQMAERDVAGTDVAYDLARVRANLAELLGTEGVWIPNSDRVRRIMEGDPRYPRPHAETWTPLRDLEAWCARVPRWRGGDDGARPVLGRHGRDHPLKWPTDPEALRAAYCAGRPCETRFLGGARHARARLRRWPRNWSVEAFGSRDVREFLSGLDVFLHFPDPAYVEEFGGAAMEAMAAGVPVILALELAEIYGEASLTATPDDVWPLVERLWRDEAFWKARVTAGRAFVADNCGYAVFPGRIERLFTAEA